MVSQKFTKISTIAAVFHVCNSWLSNNRGGIAKVHLNMSSKLQPPKFVDDLAGYPEYKKKLQRWSRITKTPRNQQAEVVLYHLEGHSSGIQEKIDTALGEAVVGKDDGLDKLIEFLDTIYKEDEMTEAWTKYKQFTWLKRSPEQPVTEYIAEFDKAHSKAKESGCEFSDIVLAFTLLESCQLTDTDEKFILTAVDFKVGKQQKNLLDQVKSSLRKFQSRERMSDSKEDGLKLKEEDVFAAAVKEVLLAKGWKPPKDKSRKFNSLSYKGKKNPLNDDGHPYRCHKCLSEYHMADKCDQHRERPPNESTEGTALSAVLARASLSEFSMVCSVFERT